MKWPILKCPFCGGRLPNTQVWPNRPLTCPTCSRELQPEMRQLYLSGLIGLGLTMVLVYLLGLRGLWFFGGVVFLWFPVCLVWDFIYVRIATPRFEPYGGKDSHNNDAGHRLLGK